jgi:DNA-binding beta-propeller fold protein YncE
VKKHALALLLAACACGLLRAQTATPVGSFGGPGSGNAQFNSPLGIAVNQATGQIYVADPGNNRIERFSAAGLFELSWGSSGTGNGQFDSPFGIAVNQSTGQVYVSDENNNRIQRFNYAGGFELTWGSSGAGNGQFDSPGGVAINQTTGDLYVTDLNNNRVQHFTGNGVFIGKWGTTGSGNGQFNVPRGIAVNSATGQVYVGDSNNGRVQRFTANGNFQLAWGSLGDGDGQFTSLLGVDLDGEGRVCVSDDVADREQIFDADGHFLLAFGSAGSGQGQLSAPRAAVFAGATALVADSGNNRISRWQLAFPSAPASPPSPTLTISGKTKITTDKVKLVLKGRASDAGGTLARVEVKVGNARYKPARGTTSWKFTAKLRLGKNKILVRAVDVSGVASPPRRITVKVRP